MDKFQIAAFGFGIAFLVADLVFRYLGRGKNLKSKSDLLLPFCGVVLLILGSVSFFLN